MSAGLNTLIKGTLQLLCVSFGYPESVEYVHETFHSTPNP